MSLPSEALRSLQAIPDLTVRTDECLAPYARFGLGGPAAILCRTNSAEAFRSAFSTVRRSALPTVVIGGGTNLVISDDGYDGVILQFTGARIERSANSL